MMICVFQAMRPVNEVVLFSETIGRCLCRYKSELSSEAPNLGSPNKLSQLDLKESKK